ncbi:hypothetical protein TVAG_328600 [Trichomonas vaginalis G3]|uniref:Dedicator of cytokinesis family protein n=1 Tax=Trichomonas vaginalis (strain ATCC PRA-98 / G3) TaxID=412133 RepID=A2F4T5_TRIV3|nr:dedicator of cytokinesis DOCK family [Trichomonas vaginalis G3]EAY00098.1 hypothetical protein TVAG_328600 [Trichomonas vaginalis G3]KAI5547154.1 dedicator of cytokinesis DOCK family [Trichomonas vaginalis G3]|eukprot:XP_001313027.1 hypothetical protein [Trichomonas vaginalis G3]
MSSSDSDSDSSKHSVSYSYFKDKSVSYSLSKDKYVSYSLSKDSSKKEEAKKEEPQKEEPKQEEPPKEEPKETPPEEVKKPEEQPKEENSVSYSLSKEDKPKEEPPKEEPKESPPVEEKKPEEQPKQAEEPPKEENSSKKEEPKKEEPKKEEPKPEPKPAPKAEEKKPEQKPAKEEKPKPQEKPAAQTTTNTTYVNAVNYDVQEPLEFLPGAVEIDEIRPFVTESDTWKNDSKIEAFLNGKDMVNKEWNSKIVSGYTTTPNILATETTKDIYTVPSYKKHPVVQFYAEDYRELVINQPNNSSKSVEPTRDILYQTELPNAENPVVNSEINTYITEQYFSINGKPNHDVAIPEVVPVKRTELKFLEIELSEFKTNTLEQIEPIIFNGYLFKSGRIITDRWAFTTNESAQILNTNGVNFKPRQKAAFELGNSAFLAINDKIKSQEEYLVIELLRPLLVDNGAAVNKYYLKPSNASQCIKARECVKTSFPRTKQIFATFAYTFVSLKELTSGYSIELQQPILCDTPPNKELLAKFLEKPKKVTSRILPFQMILKAKEETAESVRQLQDEGYEVIHSLIQNPNNLAFQFRNQITFGLRDTSFKPPKGIKARNILARITMVPGKQNDKKPIKLLHSNIDDSYVDSVVTQTIYHNETPEFDDTFVADLPNPLPKELGFNIEFFHGVAQLSDVPMMPVGRCYAPIYNEKGIFENRKITLPIHYEKTPSPKELDPKNHATFFMVPRSHFLAENVSLQKFLVYASCCYTLDPESLSRADRASLNEYMVPILELTTKLSNQQPLRAIHCFITLSQKIDKATEKGTAEQRFAWYAKSASFRTDMTTTDQTSVGLLSGYKYFLDEMKVENDQVPVDHSIIRLIFDLVVKSIMLTKCRTFMNAFEEFANSWSKVSYKLSLTKSNERNQHFVTFCHKLFDIGCGTAVYEAIKAFWTNIKEESDKTIFVNFVEQILTPKVFISLSLYHDGFINLISDIMKKSTLDKMFSSIFTVCVSCIDCYSNDYKCRITTRYLNRLSDLCPIGSFPYANEDEIHPILIWFTLLIQYLDDTSIQYFYKQINKDDFFKSVNFVLSKIRYNGKDPKNNDKKVKRQKEITYTVHFASLNILRILSKEGVVTEEKELILLGDLYYHLFCANKNIDIIKPLIVTFTDFAIRNIEFMFYKVQPCFARFIAKIFILNPIAVEETNQFLFKLYEADDKITSKTSNKPNNNKSNALCYRAFNSISSLQRSQVKLQKDGGNLVKSMVSDFNEIIEIEKRLLNEPNLIDEVKSELIYNKAVKFICSPDSALNELNVLAEFYSSRQKYEEEIQVLLLQSAIILEYSTLLGKMKFIWDPDLRYHPGQVLLRLCPAVTQISCPIRLSDDPPFVPSFCDSTIFSERSFTDILHTILQKCQTCELHEVGYSLIDIFWPLLEHHRMFGSLCNFFKTQESICEKIENYPGDKIRQFGNYYFVTFYNQKFFGKESGINYIFKEDNDVTIDHFKEKLLSSFENIHGKDKIEIHEFSGKLDPRSLSPDKGHIQVSEVEPNFTRKELAERITTFELEHDIQKFAQDEIFVKDGLELEQSEYSDRWIRRQIYKPNKSMPSCTLRVYVAKKDIDEVEYSPIRVAYRNLSQLVSEMRNAIDVKDYATLQSHMKFSLLDLESQTPLNIAKIFLSDRDPSEAKYNKKLCNAETDFLNTTKKALLSHAEFCKQYPSAIPVQNELESAFQIISDSITRIINQN